MASQALFDKLLNVGIEQQGSFTADLPHFPEGTDKMRQTPDQAAVRVEFNIEAQG